MQETWVQSLDWEDPLEEGMATHSSILAWRILMDRGAWRATSPWGHKESDTTEGFALSESGALRLGRVFLRLGPKELEPGKGVGVCVFNSSTCFQKEFAASKRRIMVI